MSKIHFHKREKQQERENWALTEILEKHEGMERNEKKTLGYKSFWPKGRNI